MKKAYALTILLGGIMQLTCMENNSDCCTKGIYVINRADYGIEIVISGKKTAYMPTNDTIIICAHSTRFIRFDKHKKLFWLQQWQQGKRWCAIPMAPSLDDPFVPCYQLIPAAEPDENPRFEKQAKPPSLQEMCLGFLKNNDIDMQQALDQNEFALPPGVHAEQANKQS